MFTISEISALLHMCEAPGEYVPMPTCALDVKLDFEFVLFERCQSGKGQANCIRSFAQYDQRIELS